MVKAVRRRYMIVEVLSDAQVSKHEFTKSMFDSLLTLYGEYGASKTELRLLDYDRRKKQALISCLHKAVPTVHSALTSIRDMAGNRAIVRVLRVSGTIKSLKRKR